MKYFGNILIILLLAWVGAKELGLFNPVVGVMLKAQKFKSLNTGKLIELPDKQNAVWLYWASWCAPCKLEMERLSNANIDHSRIFAINMGESIPKIKQFMTKNRKKYPFTYVIGGELAAKQLKVSATPSVFHFKNDLVTWSRQGMSLFGIWRAESLIPNVDNK